MTGNWIQLLQVFPDEIWLMILKNVQDSTDLQNVWNASSHFQNLLRPAAVQVLFPAVIEILLKSCTAQFFYDGRYSNEILRLRQVCRRWKHGVDGTLQNEKNYHRYEICPVEIEKHPLFKSDVIQNFVEFRSVQSLEQFERHFDRSHLSVQSNPFLFRGIRLVPPQVYRDVFQFYRACATFLQKYGKHVLFCMIRLEFEKCLSEVRFYEQLNKILGLMPNLKLLYLSNDSAKRLSETHLKKLAKQASLPGLKDLKSLHMEYVPLPVVNELIEKNQQITLVDCVHETCDGRLKMYLETLPFLNCLCLKLTDLEQFRIFCEANVKCELTRLQLDLSRVPTSIESIFKQLNRKFSESLLELSLCLPQSTRRPCRECLVLSKLKILHLEFRNIICLDVLIPLKNTLEEISILHDEKDTHAFDQVKNIEQKIRFYQFWRDPQNSNIWTEFSKLRTLRTAKYANNERYTCIRLDI